MNAVNTHFPLFALCSFLTSSEFVRSSIFSFLLLRSCFVLASSLFPRCSLSCWYSLRYRVCVSRLFLACSFPFSKCFKIIFHSHKFAAFAQLVDNFIICQKIKQVCIGIFDDFIYHTVYAPTFISSLKFWK